MTQDIPKKSNLVLSLAWTLGVPVGSILLAYISQTAGTLVVFLSALLAAVSLIVPIKFVGIASRKVALASTVTIFIAMVIVGTRIQENENRRLEVLAQTDPAAYEAELAAKAQADADQESLDEARRDAKKTEMQQSRQQALERQVDSATLETRVGRNDFVVKLRGASAAGTCMILTGRGSSTFDINSSKGTFAVERDAQILSCTAQKAINSVGKLTIEVYRGSKLIQASETEQEFGVVSVSVRR